MSQPKFSVIIPTHNGEQRIGRAIASVTMQTYKDYELIVVCDACTDDTQKYVANLFVDDPSKVNIVTTNFQRDGLARNAGLDAATGDWILFLDDDDFFLHEYCFELLADQVGRNDEDVLDFSFIWKDAGYKVPSPDEQFVMVWCRAWRRSFIDDNRFNDKPYASDKDFYVKMIQENPNVTVKFWNCPMYYYNYLREGSLSWMDKKATYLDIIITHYDEPWELGRPFFDMLQHQRCAEMDKVTVTLVQDGVDTALPWDELLKHYNYKVNVLTIGHAGTAAARNAGLRSTFSPWVTFCNFDDSLSDRCSLSMMLENFPTEDYDIIWGTMVQECRWFMGTVYMNRIDGACFANTDGKMYRRKVLEDNNITFDESSKYFYDRIFNVMMLTIVEPFRIATLTTEFYPYFKTYRKDSLRHSASAFEDMIRNIHGMDMAIISAMHERGLEYDFRKAIAKAIFRYYYAIYDPDRPEKPDVYPRELLDLYVSYRSEFKKLSVVDLDPIASEIEVETMNVIQNYYNEHKREYYLLNDSVSFEEWLSKLDDQLTEDEPIVISDPVIVGEGSVTSAKPEAKENPRVVVYCGTFDVYMNMVASLKSLLSNVAVDKVYFLIEDDKFPYDIPDIVECINVSDQKWFPKDGPNFNNSWTWMCMIRAAFPEIFPQYDKILSLDVDIVVNDNVKDLWDYDISDYYLAGVPERQRQKTASDPLYINFGVVLMNLKKLREDGKQAEIIDILNTTKVDCPEQGAFNRACAGHILGIPADFNYTTYSHITADAQKERIIHYAGQKFWRHYALVKRYADRSWKEIMERQRELHNE